jgi:hypothetical protein
LHGPAAHWSRCASLPTRVPQHLAAGQLGVRLMWVPRVIPRFWAAFSGRARSPGLAPFCILRLVRCSTPHRSPVGRLGIRLARGGFSVTGVPCFPPSETPSEFLIRGYTEFRPRAKKCGHRYTCHNEPEFELPWSNDTARQLKLSVRILVPTSLAATLQGRCGQTLQDRGGVHRHS